MAEVEAAAGDREGRRRVEVLAVPISALRGTNVVVSGPDAPWYGGPTILEYLESEGLIS